MKGLVVNPNLLNIHKRSGDTHIGQTLTRLAKLAAAAHRYEATAELEEASRDHASDSYIDTPRLMDGRTSDPTSVAHPARKDVGPFHTEVDR